MQLATVVALMLVTAPLAPIAHADIRPPQLPGGTEKSLAGVKVWALAAKRAMKSGDMAEARKLCDARGYEKNLVGGSGETLESLFEQGARKGWYLDVLFDETRPLAADRGAILHAWVHDDKQDKLLDEVWVLLIRNVDLTGKIVWVALGGGEKLEQVDALAKRFSNDQPLAPPADKPEQPGHE